MVAVMKGRACSVSLALLLVFLAADPVLGTGFFSPSTGHVAIGAFKTEATCMAGTAPTFINEGIMAAANQGCMEFDGSNGMSIKMECDSSGSPVVTTYSTPSCNGTIVATMKIPMGCHRTSVGQDLSAFLNWSTTSETVDGSNYTAMTGGMLSPDSNDTSEAIYLKAYCPSTIEAAVGSQAIYHYVGNSSACESTLFMAQSLTFVNDAESCTAIDSGLMTFFKNTVTAITAAGTTLFGSALVSNTAQQTLSGAESMWTGMGTNGVQSTMLVCNRDNEWETRLGHTASFMSFSDTACSTLATAAEGFQINYTLPLDSCTYGGCSNAYGTGCGSGLSIYPSLRITGICSATPTPTPTPMPTPNSTTPNSTTPVPTPTPTPTNDDSSTTGSIWPRIAISFCVGLVAVFIGIYFSNNAGAVTKSSDDKDTESDSDTGTGTGTGTSTSTGTGTGTGNSYKELEELEEQEGSWMDMLGLSSSEPEPKSRPASALSSLVPEAKLEEESASTKAGKKSHTRASAKKDSTAKKYSAAKKEKTHAKKKQHRG